MEKVDNSPFVCQLTLQFSEFQSAQILRKCPVYILVLLCKTAKLQEDNNINKRTNKQTNKQTKNNKTSGKKKKKVKKKKNDSSLNINFGFEVWVFYFDSGQYYRLKR